MRYIGSKLNLLPQLNAAINTRETKGGIFCDIFSGTGTVGKYFKNGRPVISNDILYFSHILQFANIELNEIPDFSRINNGEPFAFLNNINVDKFHFFDEPFVANSFSTFCGGERKYFTERNALHIDAIRQSIENWVVENLIDINGAKYLLASLIEAVPSISNIAGTYGAYLKHWDPRTAKPLELQPVSIINNKFNNYSYNENANSLIKRVSGEILYVDPPYNGRQYLGNYHVLETIAKYDAPKLKGLTGVREDLEKVSNYCKKGKVAEAFDDLLNNANFDFVFISYSTEGILSVEELVSIAEKHSDPKKIEVYKFPYRRYSRIKDENKPIVHELIISAAK